MGHWQAQWLSCDYEDSYPDVFLQPPCSGNLGCGGESSAYICSHTLADSDTMLQPEYLDPEDRAWM